MSAKQNAPPVAAGRGEAGFDCRQRHDFTTQQAPIQKLLPRLDKVRQTAPDRWIARCAAHPDDSPSLSIRELPDGVVLLKCWAGCPASDVVDAAGLHLRDLFPRDHNPSQLPRPGRRWLPRDALLGLLDDALLVLVCCEDVARGVAVPENTRRKLAMAAGRIWRGCEEVTRGYR